MREHHQRQAHCRHWSLIAQRRTRRSAGAQPGNRCRTAGQASVRCLTRRTRRSRNTCSRRTSTARRPRSNQSQNRSPSLTRSPTLRRQGVGRHRAVGRRLSRAPASAGCAARLAAAAAEQAHRRRQATRNTQLSRPAAAVPRSACSQPWREQRCATGARFSRSRARGLPWRKRDGGCAGVDRWWACLISTARCW